MPASNSPITRILLTTVTLTAFAVGGVALVAWVNEQTRDRITENERQILVQSLNQVLPAEHYDNDLLADRIVVSDRERLGSKEALPVFRARLDGKPAGVVMEVIAPNGYNGDIRLLVGILADGTLSGVRVLSHKETPGLGDVIESGKSDWLAQFPGRKLTKANVDDWAVKKDGGDFSQLTGATITPRAVVEAVKQALQYFDQHNDMLFDKPANEADDEI
ncbi:MAG: electron transport complex subunit RsxG [Gammaproteobacteria bacterium]|nr:electron transport complex subunit RsxG [Gammaproteobacteria bacterium]